ncbi:MAG: S9 family peptidase [Gammaproteobacteria bacterium]
MKLDSAGISLIHLHIHEANKILAFIAPAENKIKFNYNDYFNCKNSIFLTPRGNFFYFQKNLGTHHSASLWKKDSFDNQEEIFSIKDIEQFENQQNNHIKINGFDVTQCGRLLAIVIKSELQKSILYVKDLHIKKVIYTEKNVFNSLAWTEHNHLLYVVNDEFSKPRIIKKLVVVGNNISANVLYRETSSIHFLTIKKSTDQSDIFVVSKATNGSQCLWYKENELLEISQREEWNFYDIDSNKNDLLILKKNEEVTSFIRINKNNVKLKKEIIILAHKIALKNFGVINNYLFFNEINFEKNEFIFNVFTLDQMKLHRFNSKFCNFNIINYTHLSKSLIVKYSDLCTKTKITYIRFENKNIFYKLKSLNRSYGMRIYTIINIACRSSSKEIIPLTIITRRENQYKKLPLILYVYGAYGINSFTKQDHLTRMIVDSNMHYGIAHIPGGGEKGVWWHRNGVENRLKALHDFVQCSKYLIDKEYTMKGKITCYGRSAGAIAVCYAINNFPEYYNGAVLISPYVNMLSSETDMILNKLEIKEWGNFSDENVRDKIKKIDPYLNIKKNKYPNILIITNIFDRKIKYQSVIDWIEKIRKNNQENTEVFLKLDFFDCHGDPPDKENLCERYKTIHKFIISVNLKQKIN